VIRLHPLFLPCAAASTADWVQANYDTQVPGSDFLTCGKPSCTQRATLILVK